MAQISGLYAFSANTIILSGYVNYNFTTIQNVYNAHDTATTGVHGVGAGTIITSAITDVMKLQTVPIGSIIPFYDYNAALSFNTTYWAYCNGQSTAVGSLGAQTLPDLSNRYLVGFGTEGGADNGSAVWATAAVGNASHQIDIAHTHTYSGTTGLPSSTASATGVPSIYATSVHTHTYSGTTVSSLSATQTIQPRSISVRWIMRIL